MIGNKRKFSLMLAVIMLLQIILPTMSVIWDTNITLISRARDTFRLEMYEDGYILYFNTNNSINSNTSAAIEKQLQEGGYSIYDIRAIAINYQQNDNSINIDLSFFKRFTMLKMFYLPANCDLLLDNSLFPDSKIDVLEELSILNEIIVDEDNPYFYSHEGVLYRKSDEKLLLYPTMKQERSYTIPDGVWEIGESSFENCRNLTELTIPRTVDKIGANAFRNSNIETFIIKSRDIDINNSAFERNDYDFNNTICIYCYSNSNVSNNISKIVDTPWPYTVKYLPISNPPSFKISEKLCDNNTKIEIKVDVTSGGENINSYKFKVGGKDAISKEVSVGGAQSFSEKFNLEETFEKECVIEINYGNNQKTSKTIEIGETIKNDIISNPEEPENPTPAEKYTIPELTITETLNKYTSGAVAGWETVELRVNQTKASNGEALEYKFGNDDWQDRNNMEFWVSGTKIIKARVKGEEDESLWQETTYMIVEEKIVSPEIPEEPDTPETPEEPEVPSTEPAAMNIRLYDLAGNEIQTQERDGVITISDENAYYNGIKVRVEGTGAVKTENGELKTVLVDQTKYTKIRSGKITDGDGNITYFKEFNLLGNVNLSLINIFSTTNEIIGKVITIDNIETTPPALSLTLLKKDENGTEEVEGNKYSIIPTKTNSGKIELVDKTKYYHEPLLKMEISDTTSGVLGSVNNVPAYLIIPESGYSGINYEVVGTAKNEGTYVVYLKIVAPMGVSTIYVKDNANNLTDKEINLTNIGTQASIFDSNDVSTSYNEITKTLTITGEGEIPSYSRGNSPVPDEVEHVIIGEGITKIGTYVFYNKDHLKDVIISDSVTLIGDAAFEKCSALEEVKLPAGINRIGEYVFSECTSLEHIDIPSGVTEIGTNAFRDCIELKSILLHNANVEIKSGAFYNCSKVVKYTYNTTSKELTIGKAKTGGTGEMANYPSKNSPVPSDVKKVVIEQGITRIGIYAFYNKQSLEEVEIADSVTLIGDAAFEKCSKLKNINVPEGVTEIRDYTFSECGSLAHIELPNGVTQICKYAFNDCQGMKSIILPTTVTSFGTKAFGNCVNLIQYIYNNESKELTIAEVSANETGIIPDYAGSNSPVPSDVEIVTISKGIKTIGKDLFNGRSSLKTVIFADSVETIRTQAFRYCTGLTTIDLGKGLKTIGDTAFDGCDALAKVTMPASVESIGMYAFNSCDNLSKVIIPSSAQVHNSAFQACPKLTKTFYIDIEGITWEYEVQDGKTINVKPQNKEQITGEITIPSTLDERPVTSIGEAGFSGCSNLTNITIPITITGIGNGAFSYCGGLTKIIIPEGVKSISTGAFSGCSNLTTINLPTTLTSIGDGAFLGCEKITEVEIPEGVTKIDANSFAMCNALRKVTIPASVTEISETAFYGCDKSILTIYCNENSAAQIYAINNSINFVLTDVDIIAPIIQVRGNLEEWTRGPISIYIIVEDEDSGVAEVKYKIGEGSWKIVNEEEFAGFELPIDANGTITIKANDKAGNEGEEIVRITKIDGDAPIIRVDGEGATRYLTVTDEESGVAEVKYRINEGEWIAIGTAELTGYELSINESGEVQIYAIDKVGNENFETITIEDEPGDGTGDEPGDGTEDEPGDGTGDEPGDGTEDEPGDGTEDEPVVTSTIYKITGSYIKGLQAKTTISRLLKNITTNAATKEVYKGTTKVNNDQNAGTGMKIKVKLNNETKEYTLVVTGDITGEGEIAFRDMLELNKHRLAIEAGKTGHLTGAKLQAADMDGNNVINFRDMLNMNKARLNS